MDDWAEIWWQAFEEVEDRRSQLGIQLGDEKGSEISLLRVGFGMLTLTVVGIWARRKLKDTTKRQLFSRNWDLVINHHMKLNLRSDISSTKFYKLEELNKVTNNFSKALAIREGAFGALYKATLLDGRIVTIKKSSSVSSDIIARYVNEVVMLSDITQRNIVRMLGCCLESDVPIIVYEHISKGTLFDHLHDADNFSWENRICAVRDIASAVTYLHYCKHPYAIYHKDLESRNILLDENYKVAICDFGISRVVPFVEVHNDKCDVYAFGVVVAEILSGQKVESSDMVDRFCSAIMNDGLVQLLWKVPSCDEQLKQIVEVAKVAQKCLQHSVLHRPSIKQVIDELREISRC